MLTKRLNDEVFVADERIVQVTRADVTVLKDIASRGKKRRARLCAHKSPQDPLHEMLIVLHRDGYVQPHKHPNKSESFHVLEGRFCVVIFDEGGAITDIIRMGDYASGRKFYYRLADAAFHTVYLETELAIVHETTNGPFDRKDTLFAPWAPTEEDEPATRAYLGNLGRAIETFESKRAA